MSTIDHGDFKHVHGKPVHRVILVTGATGNVGRHVVTQLQRTGARVRALARDPASAGLPSGVDVVRGDLSTPGTVDACLNGVDAVFLLWPGLTADLAPAVLDAIRKHARRLVFLSSLGIRGCEVLWCSPGIAWLTGRIDAPEGIRFSGCFLQLGP
jgi:uncharacterized protein YbjT (DUF2867 family)